jgi:hypothetical protein
MGACNVLVNREPSCAARLAPGQIKAAAQRNFGLYQPKAGIKRSSFAMNMGLPAIATGGVRPRNAIPDLKKKPLFKAATWQRGNRYHQFRR